MKYHLKIWKTKSSKSFENCKQYLKLIFRFPKFVRNFFSFGIPFICRTGLQHGVSMIPYRKQKYVVIKPWIYFTGNIF